MDGLAFINTLCLVAFQIQSFEYSKTHNAPITCLEWSLNGLKLFSGDETGVIYCLERNIDTVRYQQIVKL